MSEREGFYEKLWRDFVSLQRGDVQQICKRVEKIETLFDAIKHGDEKHQAWLKEAIEKHFTK